MVGVVLDGDACLSHMTKLTTVTEAGDTCMQEVRWEGCSQERRLRLREASQRRLQGTGE